MNRSFAADFGRQPDLRGKKEVACPGHKTNLSVSQASWPPNPRIFGTQNNLVNMVIEYNLAVTYT